MYIDIMICIYNPTNMLCCCTGVLFDSCSFSQFASPVSKRFCVVVSHHEFMMLFKSIVFHMIIIL